MISLPEDRSDTVAPVQRVLVIALKHIGDVLVATPVLRALREYWPQAEIELLVSRGMGELVRGLPHIAVMHEVDRAALRGRPLAEWSFVRQLRARRYDVAIDLTGGERGAWYAFLSGAKTRVGPAGRGGLIGRNWLFGQVTTWGSGHYAQNFLDILAPLGITGEAGPLEIAIPPAAIAAAQRMLTDVARPRVLVHPVSRWMFKSWPVASCAATIKQLLDNGLQVIISSGPAESELAHVRQILASLPDTYRTMVADISGKITLPELAGIMSQVDVFAGVDSAPLHMASALNIKTVVLFGPSGEHNWGPWKNNSRVLASSRACRPCGSDGCNGSKSSTCLEQISPEEIIAAIHELLK